MRYPLSHCRIPYRTGSTTTLRTATEQGQHERGQMEERAEQPKAGQGNLNPNGRASQTVQVKWVKWSMRQRLCRQGLHAACVPLRKCGPLRSDRA